jgi:hypothetical protein
MKAGRNRVSRQQERDKDTIRLFQIKKVTGESNIKLWKWRWEIYR